MAIVKSELEEAIRENDMVKITLSDGYSYNVGNALNWVGGRAGFFMTDLLGNVCFTGIGNMVNHIFAFLERDGRTIDEIDF